MVDPDEALPDATPDRDYDTVAETPETADAADRPKVPSTLPPAGACDCDLPLPAAGAASPAWADRLRARLATLELDRAVLVRREGPFSLPPEGYAALEGLKREARLVLPLPDDPGALAPERARAFAGLYVRDPSAERIAAVGPRLAELGLTLEIECDDLAPRAEAIAACPAEVVIAGIGPLPAAPDDPAFRTRRALVADGHAWIKLAGLAATGRAPWEAAEPFVAALAEARPGRCLWGTGPGAADAGQLLDAFFRAVTDPSARQAILVDNPARLYRYGD